MKLQYLVLDHENNIFEEFKTLKDARKYVHQLIDGLLNKEEDLSIIWIGAKLGIDKE